MKVYFTASVINTETLKVKITTEVLDLDDEFVETLQAQWYCMFGLRNVTLNRVIRRFPAAIRRRPYYEPIRDALCEKYYGYIVRNVITALNGKKTVHLTLLTSKPVPATVQS